MADDNAEKMEAEANAIPEAQPADTAPQSPEQRIAALEAEVADLKDKLLRALAEAENVRRRAERQRVDASRYAISSFAREIIGVADNLSRALAAVDSEARAKDEKLEALCAGVEMTEREMLNVFERFEVRRVEAMGKRFDHNLHEAMFEVEDPSKPAGTVMHVMETGYVIGDRLLRAAKVGVAKGGPKADPASEEQAPDVAAEPNPKAAEAYGHTEPPGGKLDEEL
jgi:molecular chaperone GrpE